MTDQKTLGTPESIGGAFPEDAHWHLSNDERPACEGTGLRLAANNEGYVICPHCGAKFRLMGPGCTTQLDKHFIQGEMLIEDWVRLYVTASLSVELPSTAEERYDLGVASFWKPGEGEFIQFLGRPRRLVPVGAMKSAKECIAAVIERKQLDAQPLELSLPYEEYAATIAVDEKQRTCLYIYIIWSQLYLLISISGRTDHVLNENHWTRRVLKSIRVQ